MPPDPHRTKRRPGCLFKGGLFIAITVAAMLGYGYVQAVSSGWLSLYLYNTTTQGPDRQVKGANLRFLDASGQLLAEGKTDPRLGVLYLNHPEMGYCHEATLALKSQVEQRTAWKPCHAALSEWIVDWSGKIAAVDLRTGDCNIRRAPLTPRVSRDDWWLWWVPHPHIGGTPYTTYSLTAAYDPQHCTLTGR